MTINTISDIISQNNSIQLSTAPREVISELQTILRGLNYYTGNLDGLYGPLTAKAWGLFKQVNHQTGSDVLTSGSLKLLMSSQPLQKQPYQSGYLNLWQKCVVKMAKLAECDCVIKNHFLPNQDQYRKVESLTNVPWWMIAILHYREADCDFSCHLANGDPLSDKTYHVPAGLIEGIDPPYNWVQGAVAALEYDGITKNTNWSISSALYHAEIYNGLGYFHLGVNSPYVWAGTNLYTSGKFTSDGIYSANAVDSQLGVAALLGRMIYDDIISIEII